jgi:hypothetical protein
MAGTQKITEVAGGLLTNFVLATDPGADVEQSLDGINVSGLQNGATCYVRSIDKEYRYFDASLAPPAPPLVVAPLVGPGRWIQIPSGGTGGGGCSTVYRVDPDGSGPYPTVESAIAAANVDALSTKPITVALCPGRYTIAATLDITNPNVDFIGEAEAASYLTAAPGVSPLLRISAVFDPMTPDLTRISSLVFQRLDAGTLLELTSATTSLIGSCIFISGALTGAPLIDVLAGSAPSLFTECQLINASVVVTGIRCAGTVIFADGNLSGEPAVDVLSGGSAVIRRTGAFTSGPLATVRVTDAANLDWVEGEIGFSGGGGPSVGVLCVGSGPTVHLSQIAIGASTGIQTPDDAAETGDIVLDHVVYRNTNETDTFLRIGSAYKARMLDCTCNDSAVPFDRNDTAEVSIEWGNVNVDLGIDHGGPQFVRWVTSEQTEDRSSIDTHRVAGYLQLRLRDPYTPTGTGDLNGAIGNWAWDATGPAGAANLYIKTSGGWFKVPLVAF